MNRKKIGEIGADGREQRNRGTFHCSKPTLSWQEEGAWKTGPGELKPKDYLVSVMKANQSATVR